MTEATNEMSVLMNEPISVVLAGKAVDVRKMSVRKQFQAGGIFQEKPAEGITDDQVMADRMIKTIVLATGIPYGEIDDTCTMKEVADAFKAIWIQNGFDRFIKQPAGSEAKQA